LYNTTKKLDGSISLCGDKSLSHRFLFILSLIKAKSKIKNISNSKDVFTSIDCLKKCNIDINIKENDVLINGGTLKDPATELDCRNSGSTLRMIMGLLFGQSISASFIGDKSLSKRPMNRVITPLQNMGADFISNDGKLPIQMKSELIKPIIYLEKTKSAQVKTALIFAGLGLNQWSEIAYNKNTRNHTEQIMTDIGFDIDIATKIKVKKINLSKGIDVVIPGDISSASFIIAAAILIPGSSVTVENVLYNQNRFTYIDVLINMGAKIKIENISNRINGVQSCNIIASYSSNLNGISINENQIISMIDEIPIFCIIASFANGVSTIKNAKELKFKESNRLLSIYENLSRMKADITLVNDSITIVGQNKLYDTTIIHNNDHRIAMSFEIMKLAIGKDMTYRYADIIDISFPGFYKTIDSIIS